MNIQQQVKEFNGMVAKKQLNWLLEHRMFYCIKQKESKLVVSPRFKPTKEQWDFIKDKNKAWFDISGLFDNMAAHLAIAKMLGLSDYEVKKD